MIIEKEHSNEDKSKNICVPVSTKGEMEGGSEFNLIMKCL